MRILALNGGSSSFKCRLDEIGSEPGSAPPAPLWQTNVERGADLEKLLESIPKPVDVVGHRIVQGGKYRESTRITEDVRAELAREAELAPAHNRYELEAIDAVSRALGVPQVAVFDTAFHSTLDRAAYVYPGKYEWLEQGFRRFGFHGINHQYVSRRAAEMLGRTDLRMVTCHIGNGASLAAVRDGRSIDTTMGFTPLEGLMMGTRSGSIDPGLLMHLMRHGEYSAEELDRILNQESGLFGISGVSGDLRKVLEAADSGNDRARLAFEIYTHRICREIGAMIGSLGEIDALVFTGGVGEHCAPLREMVRERFAFLGQVPMLVIPAGEEWEIVRECWRIAHNK